MARDAGAVEGEQFFDALNTANRIKEGVWKWWENLERPNLQCEDIAGRRPICFLSWLSTSSGLCGWRLRPVAWNLRYLAGS